MLKYALIVLISCYYEALFAQASSPSTRIVIASDETWTCSRDKYKLGEYALTFEGYKALEEELRNSGVGVAIAETFDGTVFLGDGAKPIWRNRQAEPAWETFAFRKAFLLENRKYAKATLTINCDDFARVYLNGQLLQKGNLSRKADDDAFWEDTDYQQLSAWEYKTNYIFDVKGMVFTNKENIIIVEAANEEFFDNHGYINLKLVIDYPETVVQPPVQVVKPPKVKPKAAAIPKAPKVAPPAVTPPPKTPEISFAPSDVKVGDVFTLKDISFGKDEIKLNNASKQSLFDLVNFLKDNPKVSIEIGGHTNLLPDEEYSRQLSEKRALSVRDFLVQQGIDPKRLMYKGYGKSQPKINGKSPEANTENQRVEVKIMGM